ncbi:MAG: 3-deoxy-D-manno-octulosonic acid transferase, partial [Pedobacter sp.]|nr:3-deoxy-D-manno-octulosonic acid transferase [Chitinophagaceae bacterium]
MKFLYHLFITVYPLIAKLISPKNEKAKLWVAGRQNIFQQLTNAFAGNTSKIIWMHCSSLGEFEQGRPIIENLRSTMPDVKFLITFFSPSGYEVRKNYNGADWVFYLPMDSPKNTQQFYNIVKPSLILFVKYEFWFYYLQQAKQRQIPLLLV